MIHGLVPPSLSPINFLELLIQRQLNSYFVDIALGRRDKALAHLCINLGSLPSSIKFQGQLSAVCWPTEG